MGAMDRMIRHGLTALLLLCPAMAINAEQLAQPESSAASAKQRVTCAGSLYRFLPGVFNFCVAVRDFQRGYYRDAVEMLKLSASWGDKRAQYALGVMYFNGDHVAADRPLGLAWLTLAAERRDPTYEAVRISAHGKANETERQHTERLLDAMRPVYTDDVAAKRAQHRFDRAMNELASNGAYPSKVCIAGITGGMLDPSSDSIGAGCSDVSFAVTRLNTVGDAYFEGWQGHVTVGALQSQESPKPPADNRKPEVADSKSQQ